VSGLLVLLLIFIGFALLSALGDGNYREAVLGAIAFFIFMIIFVYLMNYLGLTNK
jgi:hypothetical protein